LIAGWGEGGEGVVGNSGVGWDVGFWQGKNLGDVLTDKGEENYPWVKKKVREGGKKKTTKTTTNGKHGFFFTTLPLEPLQNQGEEDSERGVTGTRATALSPTRLRGEGSETPSRTGN